MCWESLILIRLRRKNKYEQIAQEEIDDVRAYYKKRLEAFEEDETIVDLDYDYFSVDTYYGDSNDVLAIEDLLDCRDDSFEEDEDEDEDEIED